MEKEKLEKFINKSCEELNKALLSFCDNGEKGRKKSELITYWINDYIKYLKFEEGFIPNKLKSYERGDIIKVNFGFNIGNEEGGLHYAVVLDNKNPQSSGVITVVPLSSLKKDEVLSKYEVKLGSELYLLMKNKLDIQRKNAEEAAKKFDEEVILCVNEINSCREMNDKVELLDGDKSKIFSLIEEKLDFLENKITNLKELRKQNEHKLKYIKKLEREVLKMNKGSKALVGQITTISKIRIYDPKYGSDILSGIKLSPENLDKITKKIADLYIYNVDKLINKEYNTLGNENSAV